MKKFTVLIMCLVLTFGWFTIAKAVAPTTVKQMQESAVEGALAGYSSECNSIPIPGLAVVDTKYIMSGIGRDSDNRMVQTSYPFLEVASVFQCSSSGTDEATITVTYLDSNWDKQTIDIELDGNNVVDGTTAIRVLKAVIKEYDISPTEPSGNVYIYENGSSITAGEPDDMNDVFLKIVSGMGMSHSLLVSTARNESYILQGIETATFATSDFIMRLWKRPLGKNQVLMLGVPFDKDSTLNLAGNSYIGEKTDFWVTVECSGTVVNLMVKTRGYLKESN